jgi:hypothetical protein
MYSSSARSASRRPHESRPSLRELGRVDAAGRREELQHGLLRRRLEGAEPDALSGVSVGHSGHPSSPIVLSHSVVMDMRWRWEVCGGGRSAMWAVPTVNGAADGR